MDDVKKIAVLFVDHKFHANWSMMFDVGVNKSLTRISEYIREAEAHPLLHGMTNVGIIEVRSNDLDHVSHGTVTNRWY